MKKSILVICLFAVIKIAVAQGGWTKITSSSNPITTFTSNGYYKGAAWVDINNDSLIDLFAMPNFVFLNNGAGSFTQLTGLNINPSPIQNPGGCSWGDINNDGYIDFITAQNPTELYINNGNSTFQNYSSSIPGLNGFASWGCALADINNDNKLDLLFAQAYGFHGSATPYPSKLFYQNTSGFSFTPITGYLFTDSLKPYTVPYFHDYDMDGDMDLFIATGPGGSAGPDYCYKNMKIETGIDTLYRMSIEPWITQLQDGQCYNSIDSDNDGDFDLCLTNYNGAASRFYVNNGGTYNQVTTPFSTTGHKLSNCWGDYDNDGDIDVLIAADNSALNYYKNMGSNNFVLQAPSINVSSGSSSIVNCDYDNDGDLDVFVHGFGNARSLWRNDTLAGNRHWINLKLIGTISNKSAIGAIVKLKATIMGSPTWQIRQITAQNTFQSQNDLRVHFGLSDATVIDTVFIFWPSGIKEFYSNLNSNQFISIIEGDGSMVGIKSNDRDIDGISIFPNPSSETVKVKLPDNHLLKTIKLYDQSHSVLFVDQVKSDFIEIPTRNLKPGLYFILAEYGLNRFLKKLIIQ